MRDRDLQDYRIDFLMIHQGLTEQQAREQVAAEQAGLVGQPEGPPSAERIFISFHPFHERPADVAEMFGHREAAWEAVWTAATEAGAPNMSHVLGRFESTAETPDEAIAWARERCQNVWILPPGQTTEITAEDYFSRG